MHGNCFTSCPDAAFRACRRQVKRIARLGRVTRDRISHWSSSRRWRAHRKKTIPDKKPIEQYEHKGKKRLNNPPVGLVTPATDREEPTKTYSYDPHLDPQLVWAGKKEHTSFEVTSVSLHVHERIDPRTIIEAVRKKNGGPQMSLFQDPVENPPLREAVEFYKHKHNWSNRLIAGDSLLVMNSLLEKEGMAGQVQMVYFDPPYGIKYGSNFQPFVNKREVKDGKDDDLTQEPEMIRAFRDTWELGIHSYLGYIRDRLLLFKDLLAESGSCFVQISDENLHVVRTVMDEVFGPTISVASSRFAPPAARAPHCCHHQPTFLFGMRRTRQKHGSGFASQLRESREDAVVAASMHWWSRLMGAANRAR